MCDYEEGDFAEYLLYVEAARAKSRAAAAPARREFAPLTEPLAAEPVEA